jgi:tetratricopeptide (TPR) repeat protein
MAFDKVKTLRAAERYLELGKIPAAVKEYCKIVENEPDDFTALNMLGDLYVRVGNQPAAISCFRRIAEHYRDQDFALKAIAMYKKIDRLQPHDTEIATHLADLYAQQDLVVEARAHYLAVANAHSKAGATQEGLEVLRKIADLDSQNTDIRIKLAEGYFKEGLKPEASAAFIEAGQQLVTRGAFDEALVVFGKALDLRPGDRVVLKGILAAHSARGTADEAAELIARASADNPDDVDLLSMLARAHVEAEDPSHAEQSTAALIAKEPSAYLRFIDVARLYLTCDKVDDAVRVVAGIAEQMLAEREDNRLLELLDELLTCDSDNVQALRLLVRAFWWQRDMEKLKGGLERLAEAAEAAGLEKDERYALTQLTRLAPEQTHHVERLRQLGGAEEDAAAEDLPEMHSTAKPQDEVQRQDESDVRTPSDSSEFVFDSAGGPSTPVGESEFEWNSVTETAEATSESDDQLEIERGFTFEAVVAEELPSRDDDTVATQGQDDRAREARTQELESVDFYIAQGYADIALDTLDLLERQFGPHEDIELRRRQLVGSSVAETPAAGETGSVDDTVALTAEEFNFPSMAPEITTGAPAPSLRDSSPVTAATPQPRGIDPGLAEIFEEYRVSAEGEAESTNGDYETHFNLGLAYKEMDLFEEALEEFQTAAGLVAPDDGSARYLQCCNLLGHCFMQKGVPQLAVKWFNKGLNSAGASEDERQALRYELAAAYEQSGDLERAIDLFTEVYGINVSYRGVNERLRVLKARAIGENGNAARNQNHEQHVN